MPYEGMPVDFPLYLRNGLTTTPHNSAHFGSAIEFDNASDSVSNVVATNGYLQQVWCHLMSPNAGDLLDTRTGITTYATENTTDFMERVTLSLDITHFNGDITYPPINYGKFGVAAFTRGGYRYPAKWINWTNSLLVADHPDCNGIDIWLAPGVVATINYYGRTGAVDFTWDGQFQPGGVSGVFNPYKNSASPLV